VPGQSSNKDKKFRVRALLKCTSLPNNRKEIVRARIFIEEEVDLLIKNEHKYKKVVDNKVIGLHQGRVVDVTRAQALLRQRCVVHAQVY
jgi:hypothetical protein